MHKIATTVMILERMQQKNLLKRMKSWRDSFRRNGTLQKEKVVRSFLHKVPEKHPTPKIQLAIQRVIIRWKYLKRNRDTLTAWLMPPPVYLMKNHRINYPK